MTICFSVSLIHVQDVLFSLISVEESYDDICIRETLVEGKRYDFYRIVKSDPVRGPIFLLSINESKTLAPFCLGYIKLLLSSIRLINVLKGAAYVPFLLRLSLISVVGMKFLF